MDEDEDEPDPRFRGEDWWPLWQAIAADGEPFRLPADEVFWADWTRRVGETEDGT